MDQNLTYIAILLDRSGSMAGSEADVVGGVNTFLRQQREVAGEALVTIARFDDVYELIYEDVPLRGARDLVLNDFRPRGGTALNDGMGRLITHVGAKLAAMPEEKRPGRVFFLVFSDGGENSSREFAGERVRAMVSEQETTYAWKFLLFGMDISALDVGLSVGTRGIGSSKAGGGVLKAAHLASAYVGQSRLGNQLAADQLYGAAHVDDAGAVRGVEEFKQAIANKPKSE